MRFRDLRKLAGSTLSEGEEEKSLIELKEQIKDIELKERICRHSNEQETAIISVIVLQIQRYLFSIANKTLGPMITNIRAVLPHLLNPDDLIASGIIRKYQKIVERLTPQSEQTGSVQQTSPGKQNKKGIAPTPTLIKKMAQAMEEKFINKVAETLQISAQFHNLFAESMMEIMHLIKYMQKLHS